MGLCGCWFVGSIPSARQIHNEKLCRKCVSRLYIHIFVPFLSQYSSPFPIPINQSYTIHECMIYIFWNLMHVRNYCLCCVGIKVSMSSKWIWCNKTSYFDRHAFVVGWDRDIMIGKANIFPFLYLSNSHFSSHFFLFHSPPTLHFPCIAFCK